MSRNDQYLRFLALRGLKERFGLVSIDPESVIFQRLDTELHTIETAGFSPYFLIVADIMRFCRESGIPTGPGRGSVCGSLVAYVVGITDVDPLRFGIPFERFLHLERIAMPDIDLDICQARRGEVIEYLHKRYGSDSVAQIITFGTMAAKGVVKDVCRVLHVDDHLSGQKNNVTGEKLASFIPEGSGADQVYLDDFMETKAGEAFRAEIEKLRIPYNGDKISVLDTCRRLEGLRRHSSVHAAGVVIADRPLIEIVPLYRRNQQSDVSIQFDMWDAESVGLLKMDILGLRTVTVLGEAERLIRGVLHDFDIKKVPLDDRRTFDLLSSGDTVGIFQLEGEGITAAVEGVRPDRFEDIVAILALYRPGPMEQLPDYIDRKHGRASVTYPLPELAEILERTYGLIVYQEQVMGLARLLAGFTPGEADSFRKAIGKKLPELIAEQIGIFSRRAIERGHPAGVVKQIGEQIAYFGRYGFNLGHATGYAFITYWTAYLKANFPTEFFAATLNSHLGEADRIGIILGDAARSGVRILSPDINDSGRGFTIVGPSEIRFGLAAIKGLGEAMVISILEDRDSTTKDRIGTQRVERQKPDGTPYKASIRVTHRVNNIPRRYSSAYDFCARLTHIPINVKKNLAVVGAFGVDLDFRKRLLETMEDINTRAKENKPAPTGLYAGPVASDIEIMRAEREVMGFYVTTHPLEFYRQDLELHGAILEGSFDQLRSTFTVAGVVMGIREHAAKNGLMAWVNLETGINGLPDVTIFADDWEDAKHVVQKDEIVIFKVKKTHHPKFGWGLQMVTAKKLDRARPDAKLIQISMPDTDVSDIIMLRNWVQSRPGKTIVTIGVEFDGRAGLYKTDLRVDLSGAALLALPDRWINRIDPGSGDSIPWQDGQRTRAAGAFRGSGDRRVALYNHSPMFGWVAENLNATFIAELIENEDSISD